MEMCVFYALGLVPDEAIERIPPTRTQLKVPLAEIMRRHGLGPDDLAFPEDEFEPKWGNPNPPSTEREQGPPRSEFSLGDAFKQTFPSLQGKPVPGNLVPGRNAGPFLRFRPH